MHTKKRAVIGITHGDINGIGYEVILKALEDSRILELFTPVIYGSTKIAAFYKKQLNLSSVNLTTIQSIENVEHNRINLINCVDDELKVELGKSTKEAGLSSFLSIEKASEDLKNGMIDAIVTAPINKDNIQSSEFQFPGHTEYFGEKFGDRKSALMMLVSDNLRIAVATGHVPLHEVSAKLSVGLILSKLRILEHSLKYDFGIIKPRIALLGLNPHAGDNGLIGKEEQEIIIPAIEQATDSGMLCFGPYSSDGFFGSGRYTQFDAILAMYHDQGLIPFKTLAMENGVNFTAGLPIVRTSPDHGTAYDIAGQNIATGTSLIQSIYLACDICKKRINYEIANANPLPYNTEERRGRIV